MADPTIPLAVLIEAREALMMVKDLQPGVAPDKNQWHRVLCAGCLLSAHLDGVLRAMPKVAVTGDAA